jgi:hypothetical protein
MWELIESVGIKLECPTEKHNTGLDFCDNKIYS